MARLGILGGTFNPIHLAHLHIAEQAGEACNLQKVLFVPASIPPHKDSPDIAPAEDRHRMALLATESYPWFEVSRIELDREGRSYTKDTLQELLKTYPGTELFYIIGADAVAELSTWRDPDLVVKLAKLLVVNRPGFGIEEVQGRFKENIEVVPVSEMDISSTEIRDRVRKGLPIGHLVPEEVEKYIREKGLYRH